MRQSPTPIKETTPYVLEDPVGIDRIVKILQSDLSGLSWLAKSFNRAVTMTNIDSEENQRITPKCWVADGQDEFEMIANDNWNSYTFFHSSGNESAIDFELNEDTQFEQTLSLYLWVDLGKIDVAKTYDYLPELVQDVLNIVKQVTLDDDDELSLIEIDYNPLTVYGDFTIDIDKTQLIYYPYRAVRFDFDALYRVVSCVVPIPLPTPTNLVASNVTSDSIGLDWDLNSQGNESSVSVEQSEDGGAYIEIIDLPAGTESYSVTGLTSETEYCYRVRAKSIEDSYSNSMYSNIDCETTESDVDPDAQAWFDRMTAPTEDEKAAINTFIVQEKADGNFALYDEFFLLVLGGTNSLVGAKSKTAAVLGGVAFDTDGATFNGVNGYIDSNFDLSTDSLLYSINDGLISSFINQSVNASAKSFYGIQNGASIRSRLRIDMGFVAHAINGSQTQILGTVPNKSTTTIDRVNNSGDRYFLDGILTNTSSSSSSSIPVGNVFVGAMNNNGVAGNYSNISVSTFLIGSAIGFDHSAHNTNIRALLTTLGTLP